MSREGLARLQLLHGGVIVYQPVPLPCLASLDAFWNASVEDVAEAVLRVGFEPLLGHSPVPSVNFHNLVYDLTKPMPEINLGLMRPFGKPPLAHVCQVSLEGILFLESRYLAARDASTAGQSHELSLILLRRGRVALESGVLRSALAT